MRTLSAGLACLAASAALAGPMTGDRVVYLQDLDGTRIAVGDVAFDADGGYRLTMREEPFTDHFLSMRPFKCLDGQEKTWCHVPYPYENRNRIAANDLTDLEYDLLFLWKRSNEYGINMWNGVYYDLSIVEGRIEGRLHEMDMDVLSAPPDAGDLRPVRDVHLEPGEPEGHWLPYLVIE
ncbi:MAG: hypothetical protein AAFQ33_06975 [Pseudomonadota bacterium]